MDRQIDLGQLEWRLSGWTPYFWALGKALEDNSGQRPEIAPIAVAVPCSVQRALRQAGIIPDFEKGFNSRQCEWVENRHWSFECQCTVNTPVNHHLELVLPGVDATGWVVVDHAIIGQFNSAHRPHRFPLENFTPGTPHQIALVFDCPERFLGQFGYTDRMPITKPRFYFTWDWMPRLVQIGITQAPYIEDMDVPAIHVQELWCTRKAMHIKGLVNGSNAPATIRLSISQDNATIFSTTISNHDFQTGLDLANLPVSPWHPNLNGEQTLYALTLEATGAETYRQCIGFKDISWKPCEDAPVGATPWLCEINGKPTFLQGANWVPLRAFTADLAKADYELRLKAYKDMGMNILRIWGGASKEPDFFYDLCDEYGLLVIQEFPMSSSGIGNMPPEDQASIQEMARIADHYFPSLSRHACLLSWTGGNELQKGVNGEHDGQGLPCDGSEPMLAMLAQKAQTLDPTHRFLPTSSAGPRFYPSPEDNGKGLHWDIHGPWNAGANLKTAWNPYFTDDDALFHSEFGMPAAARAETIRAYAGTEPVFPCDTPYWNRPLNWWMQQDVFKQEKGRLPSSLEEYVEWSQQRQADALTFAMSAIKNRFPKCGGAIIWDAHSSFPCAADLGLLEFDGTPRPVVKALSEIFHQQPRHTLGGKP